MVMTKSKDTHADKSRRVEYKVGMKRVVRSVIHHKGLLEPHCSTWGRRRKSTLQISVAAMMRVCDHTHAKEISDTADVNFFF